MVGVPNPREVYAEMERRGILADVRPDVGIRLGPHFFTTDEEIDEAVAAITEIAAAQSESLRA